jgi:hypothetical protein
MRRVSLLVLLLMAFALVAPASVIVNFGALPGPADIGQMMSGATLVQNSQSIDNVNFSFSSDPAVLDPLNGGSLCGFDAGLGGLQGTPGCVGAQVDQSGVYGATDGSLVLGFASTVYGLDFPYILVGWNGLPAGQSFGVTAVFFLKGNFVGAAAFDGSAPLPLIDNTSPYLYSTGDFTIHASAALPGFDLAVINFSPTYAINPVSGLPDFGQTTFQISGMSYADVPEPETLTMLACGALALLLGKLRRPKA